MDKVSNISDRLREALADSGKKQADLSRDLKLNKSAISRYLSGQYEPKQATVVKIAAYLDVSDMWLCGYDVPRGRPVEPEGFDALVSALRHDRNLFHHVKMLVDLSEEQRNSIAGVISAFKNE